MDTLHTVLRSIRGETKSRRDHLDVFREFLDHLDRVAKQRTTERAAKALRFRAKRAKR
ncbi:MAG: hypothetical protein WDN48_04045 [Pseudolabrys sp.]